ncbi:MAG: LysM peptidoglycan-binding domain-containing protein, partial [Gammaproteobacteria bacterium]|nr:LysM peptidoglycan-binding domain-containing protein [Gammaproteobacteria bacterium]
DQANLWDRVRLGFKLDHEADNSRVLAEVKWLQRHPDYLQRVVERAEPFLYHIVTELEARGLPTELALLPVVESAYDPFAYSPGRASGLWQFIPSTARMLDMRMDWWIDERRDPLIATESAMTYLMRLNKAFEGDWLLTLASYNAGAGNVRRAIRKNRKAGKPLDYWSLPLFRETASYVPRLLALSLIVSKQETYGLAIKALANQPYLKAVPTGGQLDLARAAELADLSVEEIYRLNPAFNQWSTHPDGPSRLLIPVEKAEQFSRRLEALPDSERLRWILHRVAPGESLSHIADANGITVDAIKKINRLKGNLIRVGESLMVPSPAYGNSTYTLNQDNRLDNLKTRLANTKGIKPTDYIVRPGDSFWSLAQQLGINYKELAKLNGMAPGDTLQPGQSLQVWGNSDAMALPHKPEVIRKVNYRVRKGESLSRIANKFNLSVSSIRQWNAKLSRKVHIHPGDHITLFVDVTQTE